jgi:hypothetical protein
LLFAPLLFSVDLSPQKCAPKVSPNLPERHFREIGSPAVQGIHVALLEVLLTPTSPETVCKYILDLALFRGDRHVGVQALTIHAIGLLISTLPIDVYLQPIWQELMSLITGDQYLTEISEPCRLVSVDDELQTDQIIYFIDELGTLLDSMWYPT